MVSSRIYNTGLLIGLRQDCVIYSQRHETSTEPGLSETWRQAIMSGNTDISGACFKPGATVLCTWECVDLLLSWSSYSAVYIEAWACFM